MPNSNDPIEVALRKIRSLILEMAIKGTVSIDMQSNIPSPDMRTLRGILIELLARHMDGF